MPELCTTCIASIQVAYRLFGSPYSHQQHHESVQALAASALGDCYICQTLWNIFCSREYGSFTSGIIDQPFDDETKISLYFGFDSEEPSLELDTMTLVFRSEGQASRAIFKLFRAELDPNPGIYTALGLDPVIRDRCTSGTTELWRYWFHQCSEYHERCRENEARVNLTPFTPARLIEIVTSGESQTLRWRLILSSELLKGSKGKARYATLSHCWGSTLHTSLTHDNIAHFRSSLSGIEDLPKTYRDALRIANSIGLRHIWIDSLCIIQDDTDDWLSQASVMGAVYEHSACNIAAAWAFDGNQGCFSTRQAVAAAPASIEFSPGTGETKASSIYRIYYQADMTKSIGDAPLNSRCWVVRERYLSRKQLSFAATQVYWECLELLASEQLPAGTPMDLLDSSFVFPGRAKPSIDLGSGRLCCSTWNDLVAMYSRCSVTRPPDKTVALAGLVERICETTGEEYCAGLWRNDIDLQLCWAAEIPDSCSAADRQNTQPRNSRTETSREHGDGDQTYYLAPSWSWLSCKWPVQNDPRYTYPICEDMMSTVQLIDIQVHSKHTYALHGLLAGNLFVRAVGIRGWVTRCGWITESAAYLLHSVDTLLSSSDMKGVDRRVATPSLIRARWDDIYDDNSITQPASVTCGPNSTMSGNHRHYSKDSASLEGAPVPATTPEQYGELLFLFTGMSDEGLIYGLILEEGIVPSKLQAATLTGQQGPSPDPPCIYHRLGMFITGVRRGQESMPLDFLWRLKCRQSPLAAGKNLSTSSGPSHTRNTNTSQRTIVDLDDPAIASIVHNICIT